MSPEPQQCPCTSPSSLQSLCAHPHPHPQLCRLGQLMQKRMTNRHESMLQTGRDSRNRSGECPPPSQELAGGTRGECRHPGRVPRLWCGASPTSCPSGLSSLSSWAWGCCLPRSHLRTFAHCSLCPECFPTFSLLGELLLDLLISARHATFSKRPPQNHHALVSMLHAFTEPCACKEVCACV